VVSIEDELMKIRRTSKGLEIWQRWERVQERKMIKKVNHVGIVVKSLDEALNVYVKTLGFGNSEITVMEDMGVKSAMVSLGDVIFELMEPIDHQSGIQAFLQKRGEGLHHVSLEVDDMTKDRKSLESRGVQFLETKARHVDNSYVSFIHPKCTKGVLLELVQRL
jgi:methylmalonyl-CoA epimerase